MYIYRNDNRYGINILIICKCIYIQIIEYYIVLFSPLEATTLCWRIPADQRLPVGDLGSPDRVQFGFCLTPGGGSNMGLDMIGYGKG